MRGVATFLVFLVLSLSPLAWGLLCVCIVQGGDPLWGFFGLALTLWPFVMCCRALVPAAEAVVAQAKHGRGFEVELAWAALQSAVKPGEAISMEVDRRPEPPQAEKPRRILARVVAGEDGGFVATGPNGAVSQGDTLEAALHNLAEAISISTEGP